MAVPLSARYLVFTGSVEDFEPASTKEPTKGVADWPRLWFIGGALGGSGGLWVDLGAFGVRG